MPKNEQRNHKIYDPAQSLNYTHVDEATFTLKYNDNNTLSGDVALDTIEIGGIKVQNQAFAMPTEISEGIYKNPAEGIVGLGFQSKNSICNKNNTAPADPGCPEGYAADPQKTWFESAQRTMQQGVFAVNMKPGGPNYYDFGSVDRSAAKGKIQYTPVDNSNGFWQFATSSYRIGSGETVAFGHQTAIADSGSSLMNLEPEVVKAYYASVPNAVQGEVEPPWIWTFPCDAKLPDFHVALGSYMATIPGHIINYEPNGDGSKLP